MGEISACNVTNDSFATNIPEVLGIEPLYNIVLQIYLDYKI